MGTNFMQGLEMIHLSVGIAHFLNCFLSSNSSINVVLSDELKSTTTSRNKKRRNGNNSRTKQPSGSNNPASNNELSEWTSLSPKSLWKQINEEAASYYKFELNSDHVDGI